MPCDRDSCPPSSRFDGEGMTDFGVTYSSRFARVRLRKSMRSEKRVHLWPLPAGHDALFRERPLGNGRTPESPPRPSATLIPFAMNEKWRSSYLFERPRSSSCAARGVRIDEPRLR